ncbi:hypothetical protein BZG35_13125 [Brevundimonas sp. LM2]|uniref:TonB-dependent receptor plug domain-containing protein n=1 Tax=Brevundimonas sp. LM2 TaxID=1938605 RepID=UPI000983BB3A|nr:TonB-dependent receptor [Brevundimonas sp. LM2]AQR62481.1 hypothetical protein BZG35_13125 [Brevundimonas sp. LM2]
MAFLAWLVGATSASAQAARYVSIPAQPTTAAVLRLGAQMGVSIGATEAAGCGRSRAVVGTYDVETALRLILADSPCGFRRIDRRTYLITRRSAPPAPRRLDPPPPLEINRLDDIVVTATRREQSLADAPYSLSAIEGAAFDASARRDTAALATRLAGLTVTNLGSGRNKLFVRGLADSPLTGQTQAMVGLYLDETRLTYDAPDPDLRLVDLERVELLRGPQSTLYGAGTLGGVLKLISRPPVLDDYQAEIAAGTTVANDAAPGHSIDLVFNTPLVRDRLALRAVLYEEVIEGAVDDPGLGLANTGGTVRNGVRASVLWRINDVWDARLASVFQVLHIDDSQYAFESLPAYERSLAIREPSNNDFNGVSLTGVGTYEWGVVKLSGVYQGHDLDRRYDATRASLELGGQGAPLAYDEADDIRAFALEGSIISPSQPPFTWLAGLTFSHYSHARTSRIGTLEAGAPLFVTIKDDDTNEAAIFGELAWARDDLKITIGGRYFRAVTESATEARRSGQLSDEFQGQLDDDDFSTKAVIEYAYRDDVLVYAQTSLGYRKGGFNGGSVLDGVYGVPGGAQPYRTFRPDDLLSHEIGLRWRTADERMSLRAAAYRVDWRSVQSDRISRDGLPFTANIGSADTRGIEVEGVWRDGPWRIDVNLTANDPRLTEEDESYPLGNGSDLPGVPRILGAVTARRDGLLFGLPGWLSGTVGYVGPSNQRLTQTTITQMGDYVTSELAGYLVLGSWTGTVRIDNLLGSDGDTFGYGNPFLVGRETVITPQRPRGLSISLARRF